MFERNQYPASCALARTHPFLQPCCPFQQLSVASWVSTNSTQSLLALLLSFASESWLWTYFLLQKGLLLLSGANPLVYLNASCSVLLSVLGCLPYAAVQGLLCTWICSAGLRGRTNSFFLFPSRRGGTKSTAARSGSLSLLPTVLLQTTQFVCIWYRVASVVTHRLEDHRGWTRLQSA